MNEAIKKWCERVILTLHWFGGASLIALGLITSVDVARRLLFNRSFVGIVEATELIMIVAIFCSLAQAQRKGMHVRVDFFVGKLPQSTQVIIRCIVLVLLLSLGIVMTWRGAIDWYHALVTNDVRWAEIYLPTWPAKLMVPIGCFFLSIQFAVDLASEIGRLKESKGSTKSSDELVAAEKR